MNRKEKKFLDDYEKKLNLSSTFQDIEKKIIFENNQKKSKKWKLVFPSFFVSAVALTLILVLPMTSHEKPSYETALLRTPKSEVNTTLSSIDMTRDEYSDFTHNELNDFSMKYASEYYSYFNSEENIVSSPLSLYMSLAMAVECSKGNTRGELLRTLNMNYESVARYTNALYLISTKEFNKNDKIVSMERLTNSIWMQNNGIFNEDTLDVLSDSYYCYPYSVDFMNDNQKTNRMIKEFISDNTNGLINNDFNLGYETVFALINTLYVKDIWSHDFEELPLTNENYTFINSDGTTRQSRLLIGQYVDGRIQEGEKYRTFFISTENGYKLKFILPKESYNLDDVFSESVLQEINSIIDYEPYNDEYTINYKTRCFFPEFSVSSNGSIKSILNNMGIADLFESDKCNLKNIVEGDTYCSDVIQANDLRVDRKGIEGSAVTIIIDTGDTDKEVIYDDFIINKSFGFILTDSYDVPLFSGAIKTL